MMVIPAQGSVGQGSTLPDTDEAQDYLPTTTFALACAVLPSGSVTV